MRGWIGFAKIPAVALFLITVSTMGCSEDRGGSLVRPSDARDAGHPALNDASPTAMDATAADAVVDSDLADAQVDAGALDAAPVDMGATDGGFLDAGVEEPACNAGAPPLVDVRTDEFRSDPFFFDVAIAGGRVIVAPLLGDFGFVTYDSHPSIPNRTEYRHSVAASPFGADPDLFVSATGTVDLVVPVPRGDLHVGLYRDVLAAPTTTATSAPSPDINVITVAPAGDLPAFMSVEYRGEPPYRMTIGVGSRRFETQVSSWPFNAGLYPRAGVVAYADQESQRLLPFNFTTVTSTGADWPLLLGPCGGTLNSLSVASSDDYVYVAQACGGQIDVTRRQRGTGTVLERRQLSLSTLFVRLAIDIDIAGRIVLVTRQSPTSSFTVHYLDAMSLSDFLPPLSAPPIGQSFLQMGGIRLAVSPDRPGELAVVFSNVIRFSGPIHVARVRLCR